ncbi:MAG: acyl-CoA dehydratase activase [Candidatus Helarchaeota archaeon]
MDITAGIDIGSLTTKCVFFNGQKLLGHYISRSGYEFGRIGEEVFKFTLKKCNLQRSKIKFIMGTGYGRSSIHFANKAITEISAHAKGINFLLGGEIKTVIDIGGQDSKAISVGKDGKVLDFVMNDKCAAGTGRFVEVMVQALNIEDISKIGESSLKSTNPANISSTCTVFAESEVISLFAKGLKKEDIIAGIHKAIAKRIVGLIKRISIQEKIAFCGSVAKNIGVLKALEEELKTKIIVPEEPQIVGALGAAILAYQELNGKRNEI